MHTGSPAHPASAARASPGQPRDAKDQKPGPFLLPLSAQNWALQNGLWVTQPVISTAMTNPPPVCLMCLIPNF